MRHDYSSELPVRKRQQWSMLALLIVACGSDPAAPPLTDEPKASFTGAHELRAVDGVDIPTTVRVGFMGASMHVQSGTLLFEPGHLITLDARGPLGTATNPITLGTGGVYVRIASDSLRVDISLQGRVSGDTVEIRSASWTLLGAHVWRYVRVVPP